MIRFGSSWGRFGKHLENQNRSEIFAEIYPGPSGFRSCALMVPRWVQDRPKRAPGGILGRLGGILGRSWGLLGPLWRVLGGFWAVLRGSWAALGGSWALLERSWRPMRLSKGRFRIRFVEHRFEVLMLFVDSIRSLNKKFAGPLAQSVSDNGPYFPSTHQPINSSNQLINSSTHQPIDQPINPLTHRFNPSTHQVIDSTHQLINSRVLEFYSSIGYNIRTL